MRSADHRTHLTGRDVHYFPPTTGPPRPTRISEQGEREGERGKEKEREREGEREGEREESPFAPPEAARYEARLLSFAHSRGSDRA